MSLALRVLAALFICLSVVPLAHAQQRAEEVRFTHAGVQADAKRYETYLKANWQPKGSGAELRAEGDRLLAAGTDPRAAARAYAQAVVFDANDAASWTGLARALLAIKPDQGAERYDLPVNASGAAWNAYERGKTPAVKAAALVVLSDALKRRSYWRPAIDALKSSLSLADDAQVREAYDALVAQHGFRIVEYKVDADSAQPRLCIQFSERLAPGQVDWSKYLKVDGKDPQAVTAEARQICLDGLAHGKRYEVAVREGLPSAIASETLAKTA
ncbi:MAG: alpha-2-macroglobulin family protein, partial [Hyphomicrobiaceae bacterium]